MAGDKVLGSGPPPMLPDKIYLNPTQDDQMEIEGYKKSQVKTVLLWICIILTVGLLRLILNWVPHVMVWLSHNQCSLAQAEVVVLKDQYDQWFVSKVCTSTKDGNNENATDARSLTVNYNEVKMEDSKISPRNGAFQSVDSSVGGELWYFNKYNSTVTYFITKKVKYIWNSNTKEFLKVRGLEEDTTCAYFHQVQGLTYEQQVVRRVIYGANSIAVHVTPIIKLLALHIISPFYVFQVFSCSLWYSDEYYYYASCIVVISAISITVTIYQTRKMQRALRNTISSSTIVTVCRGGDEYQEISSEDLVPGDVIEIPRSGCVMQCDAVLITGNCIVNESMLTGESVPVTKTPLPNPKVSGEGSNVHFNMKDHSRHVLFCGTHVIQTRYYGGQRVKAVVARTGFSTAKGELVRSILYPKPVDFKFNRDTYKFVGVLAAVAGCGFIFTIVLMVHNEETPSDIVIRSLDLITIAVPPALPAALTVGIVFAQYRLKKALIYCISPRSINVCGCINTVCFDKTGTLTEDGLDMHSIVPVSNKKFQQELMQMDNIPSGPLTIAMAACHSLTLIDGVLSGDPLELIMFDSIGWELEEPGEETSRFDMLCPTIVRPKKQHKGNQPSCLLSTEVEIGIIRQFTFSSHLQRMSVIVRQLGAQNFDLFTKGAPEMIASLSDPQTVPDDFHEVLNTYTQHGYRVLALAYRPLPEKLKYPKVQRLQREQVEKGLTFLGLLVMENRIKRETTPIIQQLRDADIRTIMVTGDNMLTALSVARECGMVGKTDSIILVQAYPPQDTKLETSPPQLEFMYADMATEKKLDTTAFEQFSNVDIEGKVSSGYHFAVTGKSWSVLRQYFPETIEKVVLKGTVFARMSPDQKAQLIEALQDLGCYVGMCGDGANDCGALKTAHAGISLSEAEASVASPFTSKTPNISCVPTVIRQGRAALVTSFGIFKYMACYSLTQFVSVLILYWIGANLTDFEFLYIDLFLLTTLSITFGRTEAFEKLVRRPPLLSLISLAPILSLVVQMIVMTGVQIFVFFFIQEQPWFVPFVDNEEDDYASYENTAIFYSSSYQYIILAVIFSKGAPYRKTVLTNYWFLGNLCLCLGLTLWMNIYPTDGLEEFLELKSAPNVPFRLIFVGIAFANFVVCFILEEYVIDSRFVTVTCQKKLESCCSQSKSRYETLEDEIQYLPGWPPKRSEEGLAKAFQRMDSAFSLTTDDTGSLLDSDSEAGSLASRDSIRRRQQMSDSVTDAADVIFTEKQVSGVDNPAFDSGDILSDIFEKDQMHKGSATNYVVTKM